MSTTYDFLTRLSFPSSLKMVRGLDESRPQWVCPTLLPVSEGGRLRLEVSVKADNAGDGHSEIRLGILPGDPFMNAGQPWYKDAPPGTYDWYKLGFETVVPSGVPNIQPYLFGGKPASGKPVTVWFDDLKIYQDDVLIYADDFSNWAPVIGAGVGAPIGGVAGYLLKEPLGPMVSEAVGAVLGGALGGGVGLLTGLGIIPVPQIPALGAAPEGPRAPARLGKYQITG